MEIAVTHYIDCSEKDADGFYAWFYEYDLFRFSESGITLVARGYTDSPDEAHFLRIERGEELVGFSATDLQSPLASAAIAHLRKLGRTKLSWLGAEGYLPLG